MDDDAAPFWILGQWKRSDEKSDLKGVEPAPDRLLRDAHVIGEAERFSSCPVRAAARRRKFSNVGRLERSCQIDDVIII